jgi:hypothetical protein
MPLAVSSDQNCSARFRGNASRIAPNSRRVVFSRESQVAALVIGIGETVQAAGLFADTRTTPVPNLNGRSHSEVRLRPFSYVVLRLGDVIAPV